MRSGLFNTEKMSWESSVSRAKSPPQSPVEGATCQRRPAATLRGPGGSGTSPREPIGKPEDGPAGEKLPLVGMPDLEVGTAGTELKPFADGAYDPELARHGGKYHLKLAVFQVTIRCPTTDPLLIVAMVYGFVPFLPVMWLAMFYRETGGFLGLYGLLLSGILVVVNEGFLKPHFDDPRPWESANKTAEGKPKPGMPSGHVLNSVTLLVWLVCEIELGCSKNHSVLLWIFGVLCLMAPVPWARYYNKDHTFKQCCYTSFAAMLVGLIAFLVRVQFFNDDTRAPWNL